MRMLSTSPADLAVAAAALRDGLLVALPTETVYGLGGNARDERALARIFAAKDRPAFDPLIVHVAEPADADGVADLSPASGLPPGAADLARRLMERFWPGPLTLILPRRPSVPDLATSGLPTVAVRCPGHPVARELIRLAGVPVAAPSANPFGYLSPTTARHVAAQLGDRVDYIVDGGPCAVGVESTVLDLSAEPPLVLRPGGLAFEALAGMAPGIQVFDRSTTSPRAPGQLPSHYAPGTPLRLVPAGALASAEPGPNAAAICFGRDSRDGLLAAGRFAAVEDLSPGRDPVEAAARLFAVLHELDAAGRSSIWAERLPDAGIGRAVNDRLYKASAKD